MKQLFVQLRMIIILEERHKEILQFLKNQPLEVVSEFVSISLDFLRKGSNPKLYLGAARTLNIEVEKIEAVVEGIAHLFNDASKLLVSDSDFLATLAILGFSKDLNSKLCEMYLQNRSELRAIQKKASMVLPHYTNLDWRLDVQLASRCLRSQLEPIFILCLHTMEGGEERLRYLQMDVANLKRICEVLENALKESKSPYCRRVMRLIK